MVNDFCQHVLGYTLVSICIVCSGTMALGLLGGILIGLIEWGMGSSLGEILFISFVAGIGGGFLWCGLPLTIILVTFGMFLIAVYFVVLIVRRLRSS